MKFTELDVDNITNELIEEIFFKIPQKEYFEADCLMIFGCHIKALLDERLKLAVEILNTKKINKILLTGGIGVYGDFNESEYMKEYLLSNGVKEENILVENKSTTTEENIINSVEILKNNDLLIDKKIVLLSQAVHLRRIGMEVKKQLRDINFEMIYEYPKISILSYENIIKDDELKLRTSNEIKKIIRFIEEGIIEDEELRI